MYKLKDSEEHFVTFTAILNKATLLFGRALIVIVFDSKTSSQVV